MSKQYEFPYFVSFGKEDSVDCEISISLTDEQSERLISSAKEGDRWRLYEDKNVNDIYELVYQCVLTKEKNIILSNSDLVAEYNDAKPEDMDLLDYIDEYLDNLMIGINYPEELQFLD